MTTKPRHDWKRLQPNSLRTALELCKDHAREKHNRSVERVADQMGITDHWTVYKWIQSGRIPANLIRPYETACGIDFVSRWIAASAGKLLVDVPIGRNLVETDVVALHNGFGVALKLLTDFYAGKAEPAETIAALTAHMTDIAWHRANVGKHVAPELDFGGD
ncbi:MAG: hypothetical protein FD135_3601 [Comamonadaceae bacterium]|nr:MAG: hypothetical protein FD135_3601 [Comamonadaceae bacterium]